MSSENNTEVYIPRGTCVRTVPLQCLPSSITRKMGVRSLLSESERTASNSSQMATWICPVELRKKGSSTHCTEQTHHFLTRGQFSLPVVSSNPTASRILSRFLSSSGRYSQADESDAPAVCSRVSSHRRNAIILYHGQIFLTVKKKTAASNQVGTWSFNSHVSVSQKYLIQGLCEDRECGAFHKTRKEAKENAQTCNDGEIRDSILKRKKEGDGGYIEDDANVAENEVEPVRRDTECPIREEFVREANMDVYEDESIADTKEHSNPDQQADGQLDGEDGEQRTMDNSHETDTSVNTYDAQKFDAQKLNSAYTKISMSMSKSIRGEPQDAVNAECVLENRGDADIADGVTAEKCQSDDQSSTVKSNRTALPIITHIMSLAEGWNSSAGTVSDKEEPKLEQHQNFRSVNGAQLTGTAEGSAQTSPPELSLQEHQAEDVLPEHLRLSSENLMLEREERIMRIRNFLKNKEAKLNTLNRKQ